MNQRTYRTTDTVDFVVVGSGAAGGVLAKELSTSGFDVVVLEQGPWQQPKDFTHDELAIERQFEMLNIADEPTQTFRTTESETPRLNTGVRLRYRRGVGGTSVHFSGNYWRFRPSDFRERSIFGSIAGTGFSDWPISYEELEPYYTKVDWEIGVSGEPGPFDAPRSRPFPLPPLPAKSSGVLLERAAKKLGLHAQVAPMAILSRQYDGRPGCMACGHCYYYGCEFGAKSSTLATVIPKAVATGRCEIRTESTVLRVETDAKGRATGVVYVDRDGREQRQAARVVVLATNGAETTRLLLMSTSSLFPHGLANSSGNVGRHIMFNGSSGSFGLFDEDINGRLVHVPVSGFFAAGTTFTITAFGNRGRLSSAPSGQLGSDPPTLSLQVFTWPAGSTPVVNPQTDNWSRTPGAVLTRQFTAWSTSGTWTSQTFQFVINVDQRYVALAITGKNHTSASYVAFDVAPPR